MTSGVGGSNLEVLGLGVRILGISSNDGVIRCRFCNWVQGGRKSINGCQMGYENRGGDLFYAEFDEESKNLGLDL